MTFNIVLYAYAIIGHTQVLPQLLMEQFDTFLYNVDTLNICKKEFGLEKYFLTNDSCENLDNFSLIRCLYMHRRCLYGPINSYHSFLWSNFILCLYNVDTLNICMKEFCSEKIIFDKMTAVRT